MSQFKTSCRDRLKLPLGAAAALVLVALTTAPAPAALAQTDPNGGQPAAGADVVLRSRAPS